MNVTALVSGVLGAVLAIAGGVATELWKQRTAARAAARLVWLELILARSALLGALALGEWPDDFPFSDDAWTAQRDRLALGWQTTPFPLRRGALPRSCSAAGRRTPRRR
jgi:hypothetical protein